MCSLVRGNGDTPLAMFVKILNQSNHIALKSTNHLWPILLTVQTLGIARVKNDGPGDLVLLGPESTSHLALWTFEIYFPREA